MKLKSKSRNGARVHKVYEIAQTPYQRLLQSGKMSENKRAAMIATYNRLNPVLLLKNINISLEHLWKMVDRKTNVSNRNFEATKKASVTV